MQTVRVLPMPADLEIQGGVEVPRVIMNLPQGSGMDDDRQRRATSSSLNGFANRRGNDKLRTTHKNSIGNIALQTTDGETNVEHPDPNRLAKNLGVMSAPPQRKGGPGH
jgi:hypothetical protein